MSVRFAQGAFWSLVGTVGSRLSTFFGTVIVARLLGQVGFGELAMIQSTIGMLGTFAGLGIGMTATKYVAELKARDPERTGRIIGLTYLVSWGAGGLMGLACFFTAPWLAAKTINAPHLAPEIRLASLLLFVYAGFGPQGGVLAGFQTFRAIAKINWIQALLSLPITVVLVWVAGLRGVILAYIIIAAIGGILSSLSLRKEYRKYAIRLNFRAAYNEMTILWQLSLPVFLNNTLFVPLIWAANALLANQRDGYAELGLFNAAMQFQFLINGISTLLASVSIPMLVEIHGQHDRENFAKAFGLNLKLNWSVAIVLAFVVLGLQPFLLKIFGAKFHAAGLFLPFIICFTTMNVASSITGQGFFSTGRMWVGMATTFIWGVSLMLVGSFIIPIYGGMGLAVSYLIAYGLALTLQLFILSKIIGRSILEHIMFTIIFSLILLIGSIASRYLNNVWGFHISCLIVACIMMLIILKSFSETLKSTISGLRHNYKNKLGGFYAKKFW